MTDICRVTQGLAQIQINHLSVAYIPYDLTAALRKTIKMFASECKARGITLTLNLDDSLSRLGNPRRIKADPTRMGQIMINLVRFLSASAPAPIQCYCY